jgi:16S rRNA (cytidine1402-2'-O)-methyltransferase
MAIMDSATLYLVPNLLGLTAPEEVLPAKTIHIASRLQYFLVETPKPARQFLKMLPLQHPIQSLTLTPLPEQINSKTIAPLIQPLLEGHDMGVLSDAGCPGIADPGAVIVAEAHRKGIKVVPLVGPSSILLGLMASGFNGQHFKFHGYLPSDTEGRISALKKLQEDIKRTNTTQIFIETPYRNHRLIEDMVETLSSAVEIVIAVNLTTSEENIIRSSPQALKTKKSEFESLFNKRPALFLMGASS